MEAKGPFLSPEDVQETAQYSSAATTGGGLIMNGQAAWFLSPGGLLVTKVSSGEHIGHLQTGELTVTHVCELQRDNNDSLLVLACRESKRNSIVAVYSPWSSELLRAINVPKDITSMCLLSAKGLDAPSLFTHTVLTEFTGVVAVGCAGGNVVLLDLALNKEAAPVRLSSPKSVEVASIHSESITTHMVHAEEEQANLAVNLTDHFIRHGKFNYVTPKEKLLGSYHEGSVSVTAVYYAPLICGLFIGYSFGGFHLFSLKQLSLQYTSPLPSSLAPVTHFTFLEPENDPRAYVFIWVARGATSAMQSEDIPLTITLYHFAFKQRVRTGASGHQSSYQMIEGCSPRLEHTLSSTLPGTRSPSHHHNAAATNSYLLSCFTVEVPKSTADLDDPVTDHTAEQGGVDRTLAVFVWKSQRDSGNGGVQSGSDECIFMAVFDLNRWYHAQMPAIVRWKLQSGSLCCPFLALFTLSSPSQINNALDVAVSQFSHFLMVPPVPETYFQPSSLSFVVDVLCPSLLIRYKFTGQQRQALKEVTRFHSSIVLAPQRLYSFCLLAGILPNEPDQGMTNLSSQKSSLLSACHQYGLKSVFLAAADVSTTPGQDGSLSMVIEWSSQQLHELLQEKNRLVDALLYAQKDSGDVDSFTISRCHWVKERLSMLCQLASSLLTSSTHDIADNDLETVYHLAAMHSQLLLVVLWCVNMSLLPQGMSGAVDELLSRHRAVLDEAKGKLAIDYLMEELTQVDEGVADLAYPPEDITFLLVVSGYPPSITQQCIVLYVLLELEEIGVGRKGLLDSYVVSFQLSEQLKLFAKLLWCLDHRYIVEAVELLPQQSEELLSWQHQYIIHTLLTEDECDAAISYLDVVSPSCDVFEEHLHLKVETLVAGGSTYDAFQLMIAYKEAEFGDDLLKHFLLCCLQYDAVRDVVHLPLDSADLSLVCGMLDNIGTEPATHLHTALLIQHHCDTEAILLNKQLKSFAESGSRQAKAASSITMGLSSLLPDVLQELCTEEIADRMTDCIRLTVDPPEPLSAAMPVGAKRRFLSQADMALAVAKKVGEANAFTPIKGSPPRSLISTPFISTPLAVRHVRTTTRIDETFLKQSTPVTIGGSVSKRSLGSASSSTRSDSYDKISSHVKGLLSRFSVPGSVTKGSVPVLHTPRLGVEPEQYTPSTLTMRSILKQTTTRNVTTSDTPTKKIRFTVGNSPLTSPDETLPCSVAIAIDTPLPLSDDSDMFYSPPTHISPPITSSPNNDEVKVTSVIVEEEEDESMIAEEDEVEGGIASEVGEEEVSLVKVQQRSDQQDMKEDSFVTRTGSESFIAEESDTETTSFSKQGTILPRSILSPRPQSTVTTSSLQRHTLFSLVRTSDTKRKFSPAEGPKEPRVPIIKTPKIALQRASAVMAPITPDPAAKYRFSPPHILATPDASDKEEKVLEPSPIRPYVFSPPLLRSATRERKSVELSRTAALASDTAKRQFSTIPAAEQCNVPPTTAPPPATPLATTKPSTRTPQSKKPVRQAKTCYQPLRRSRRLLKSKVQGL